MSGGNGGFTPSNLNILGYNLDSTIFAVDSTNVDEVARFGSSNSNSYLRIYTAGKTNDGYILKTKLRPSSFYPDFSIEANHLSNPCMFVQGQSGRIGIGTTQPTHTLTVKGDMFLDGNIVQSGPAQIIQSQVVESTSIYADYIYTRNSSAIIDFTSNSIKNVQNGEFKGNVEVKGELKLEGSPFVHVQGSMQRIQVHIGQVNITSSGRKELGFIISWDTNGTSSQVFEAKMSTYLSSSQSASLRQFHKYTALIDPSNNNTNKPSLDTVLHEQSMICETLGKSSYSITRHGASSVKAVFTWNTTTVGYTGNIKLDLFAPISLGKFTFTPFTN